MYPTRGVRTLNPVTLLPVNSGSPEHDCLEVMDEVFSSQLDLTDQPISHLDVEYFTHGGSLVWDGTCFAGYAVVTLDAVIEAGRDLCTKSELIALMWVPQLTAGVWANTYTDYKYAFTIIHVHGTLYKERRLINSGGKSVKYGQDTLDLLEAVWTPKQVAVMHC
jgi:hypothetical protein